jgi:hypothetical protein
MRKGRFDEIFFVDLPAADERREIFAIHLRKRHRDPANFDLNKLANESAGYSGAEIEQVVVAALFSAFNEKARDVTTDDLLKATKASIPLSVTMREGIQRLRDWAETRARPTSSVQAETVEELGNLEAAARFDASPEMVKKRRTSSIGGALGPVSTASPTGARSPFDMEAGDEVESEIDRRLREDADRISALERKTATGLDTLMGETQNADTVSQSAIPPRITAEPKPATKKAKSEDAGGTPG